MKDAVFETRRPNDYLRRLADSDIGRHYKAIALEQLGVRAGDTVVDLGCGPGADLAVLADAVGSDGHVIGIDIEAAALDEASADHSADSRIELCHGDIHALALADGSADRARTDRVLQHVAEPAMVLHEARRILRPDATAVFAEPDWDTLVVDHHDRQLSRAYTRFVADIAVRNGTIGRQLPALALRSGFDINDVLPITTVFRDLRTADRVLGFERVCKRAVDAGHLTQQQADSWTRGLAVEPFFASVTLFIVTATRKP
ncbi:methyltransferase domain-containing protein [Nocardia australiensis]|uniref:methyltransferase domain-containing protein n=1 Tax=Nocardia australiensis TaxID=2887191 RepID=UPI001D1359AF|nr:methyltransferase domain-containing protein [Nocardia australiensis]